MCIAHYGNPTWPSQEPPAESPARTRVTPQLTSRNTAPKQFMQRNTLKGRRHTSPNYDPQGVPTYRFFCVICIGVCLTVALVLATTFPQFERANERDSNPSTNDLYASTPRPTPLPSLDAAASTAAPTLSKQIPRRPTTLSIAPTPCPTHVSTTVRLPTAVPTYLEPATEMPTSGASDLPTLSLPFNATADSP